MKKLNSKRLLSFYRAERKRYNINLAQYSWGYDGIDYMWDHSDDPNYQKEKIKYEEWKNYLNLIKNELDMREHVVIKM